MSYDGFVGSRGGSLIGVPDDAQHGVLRGDPACFQTVGPHAVQHDDLVFAQTGDRHFVGIFDNSNVQNRNDCAK